MNAVVFLGILGGQELIVIVVLVLILFGGKKIPELMHGLGKGIREFKDASKSVNDEVIKGFRDFNSDDNKEQKL
jgi:sec-independent protein translocase protein TatA